MVQQHPYIVVVMGLPGSGKTFFAQQLAPALKAAHISSDQVRNQHQYQGRYTLNDKQRVYKNMLKQAAIQLEKGQPVVLDGTFHIGQFRQLVNDFATKHSWPLFYLEITADENIVRKRTSRPRPDSEADYQVYQMLKQQYEPLREPHLRLNSSQQSIDQMLRAAQDYLQL